MAEYVSLRPLSFPVLICQNPPLTEVKPCDSLSSGPTDGQRFHKISIGFHGWISCKR